MFNKVCQKNHTFLTKGTRHLYMPDYHSFLIIMPCVGQNMLSCRWQGAAKPMRRLFDNICRHFGCFSFFDGIYCHKCLSLAREGSAKWLRDTSHTVGRHICQQLYYWGRSFFTLATRIFWRCVSNFADNNNASAIAV